MAVETQVLAGHSSSGELVRSIDWKGAFWVASGVPALVLFSIGGIAGTTGKLAFLVVAPLSRITAGGKDVGVVTSTTFSRHLRSRLLWRWFNRPSHVSAPNSSSTTAATCGRLSSRCRFTIRCVSERIHLPSANDLPRVWNWLEAMLPAFFSSREPPPQDRTA